MKNNLFKKIFLGGAIFLGSFGLGSSQSSGGYSFVNTDSDAFQEQMYARFYLEKGEKDFGVTTFGFFDENGDNVYDHIRIMNVNNSKSVFVEDFYLDSISNFPDFYGFLDYSMRAYHINERIWRKHFGNLGEGDYREQLRVKGFKIKPDSSAYFKNLNLNDLKKMNLYDRVLSFRKDFFDKKDIVELIKKEREVGRKKVLKRK